MMSTSFAIGIWVLSLVSGYLVGATVTLIKNFFNGGFFN